MKSIFCLCTITLCCLYSCIAQRVNSATVVSPTSTYIKGNNFEGAIFSASYSLKVPNFDVHQDFRQYKEGVSTRFTPTLAQIESAERILRKNLRHYNRSKFNQGFGRGPVIHRRLRKYQRQYFGYTSAANEEIIFNNAVWEPYTLIDRLQDLYPKDTTWKYNYQIVMDGGSHYWSIEVNLTTGKLSGMGIHGYGFFRSDWPFLARV